MTPKPLLPEIEPPVVVPKVKPQVAQNLNASDSRLALDKARFDVQQVRKLEYKKDDKLWSVIKHSRVSSSSMLISKSTSVLPTLSYTANKLKERSLATTQKAIHSPGVLLSGVRSTREDMNYEVKAPKFSARAFSQLERGNESMMNMHDAIVIDNTDTTDNIDVS